MSRNRVKILLIAAIAIYWVFAGIPLHAKIRC